ncbi:MAG: hypothetical protein ABFD98_11085 [Syntrophobacteraceae bacterium]
MEKRRLPVIGAQFFSCLGRGALLTAMSALLGTLSPAWTPAAAVVLPAPSLTFPAVHAFSVPVSHEGTFLLAELEEEKDCVIHRTVPYEESEDLWEQERYKQERAWDMLNNPVFIYPSVRPGIHPPKPPADRPRE